MKKILIFAFGLFGFLGSAMALSIFGGPPISVMTLTQVAASTPTYVGQVVACSNCGTANGSLGTLCISTETSTANNAFILAASTQTTTATCK
jgi:hypothetical protein